MYKETTRQWIADMKAEGKLQDLDGNALDKLTDDYARRLEEKYEEAIRRQLEPVGKVAEFERMMIFDGQYMNKYLNQMIPGYPAFKMEVFNQIKKEIIGT
jgi:hypothetical protein